MRGIERIHFSILVVTMMIITYVPDIAMLLPRLLKLTN